MCGIVVAAGKNQLSRNEHELFQSALKKLEHRGYSLGETATIEASCLMGVNRLEIVDRERGKQPFVSIDRKVAIVLNGEIYNHEELREKLASGGYEFNTSCDTEVLLHGFLEWGIDGLLGRIRGMFAFIIHDGNTGTLLAARDPFGIKPLYWTKRNTTFFFASEIKGMIHICGKISEVLPGTYLSVSDGRMSQPRNFNITKKKEETELTPNTAASILRAKISEAVRLRLQTDLQVAVLLGGIDSGIILYEALKHHGSRVTAFTIGKNEKSDDILFARKFCKDLGIPLIVVFTDEDELLSIIPDVIRCIESFEPNHIRGGALSYLLSQAVQKEGFRIALCGEGADELFGGYSEYAARFQEDGYRGVELVRKCFVTELYKTQLKRVDRTSMAFKIETRVPFLDIDVAEFAMRLPARYLIQKIGKLIIEKKILREAYKGILPDYAIEQNKRVLSSGAGFGTNAEEGLFYEYAKNRISSSEFNEIADRYSLATLKNREEAFYFKLMNGFYPIEKCSFLLDRPYVNRIK